jgi:DNA-binding Lrp family transcriptional regulator
MSNVTCREIFNAVYVNVRESYIDKLYSTKIQSKSSNESKEEDTRSSSSKDASSGETLSSDLVMMQGLMNGEVRERVERMDESEVADKIRADIEEKLPFALASVCANLATLDKEYRREKGYEDQTEFSEFVIETSDDFPLSDRFAFPCIMYVSSMVLIDIDEKKSDEFYDKYASSVSRISLEIPFLSGSTVEKYPY